MLGLGLVFLLFLSLALFPTWPYSRSWGYAPSAVSAGLLLWLIGLLQIGTTL